MTATEEKAIPEILARRLERDGWAEVERLVEERVPEALHFDCKAIETKGAKLERGDRRILAEAVSGFANTDGGLLVLGLDARPVDGIDAVVRAVPVHNADVIARAIQNALPDLVDPVPARIRIVKVEQPGAAPAGVIGILVPASDNPPHQSTAAKTFTYHERVEDQFRPLRHHRIRELIQTRVTPELLVEAGPPEVILVDDGSGSRRCIVHVRVPIHLRNERAVTARGPAVDVAVISDGWELTTTSLGVNGMDIGPAPIGWTRRIQGDPSRLHYPEEVQLCHELELVSAHGAVGFLPKPLDLRFRASIAEGSPTETSLAVSADWIREEASSELHKSRFRAMGWKP